MKTCKNCGERKPFDEFHPHSGMRDKHQPICKTCDREDCKRRYRMNPQPYKDREKAARLRDPEGYSFKQMLRRYNMTAEQYLGLMEKQEGRCAICGTTEWSGKFNLPSVDHDHGCCPGKTSCGKCVRGLLCMPCNNGLGCFKDSKQRLRSAISYLD